MPYMAPTIDEYLHKRLMPVEGAIPHLPGIEMRGNSIPAGTIGGDLFEYINFQQRYDIDARIQRALRLSKEFLEPRRAGSPPCNSVDGQSGMTEIKAYIQVRNGIGIEERAKQGYALVSLSGSRGFLFHLSAHCHRKTRAAKSNSTRFAFKEVMPR